MGRRLLLVLIGAVVIVLVGAGVAAAAGAIVATGQETATSEEPGQAVLTDWDDTTTSTLTSTDELAPDPDEGTTEGGDQGEVAEEPAGTGDEQSGDEDGQYGDGDGDGPGDALGGEHPNNFGKIISDLRAAGDHTPAAVIKGKKVPGYYKKLSGTGTTTTTTVSD